MLEAFIKFADKHARVVVVGLVATIVVGSVGGGFWIHTLQSMLDEKDKMQEQRIAIVEGRLNNQMDLVNQQNTVLLAQLKILEDTSIESSRSLKEIAGILESKDEFALSPARQKSLESTIKSLQGKAEMFETTIRRVRDLRSLTLGPSPSPAAEALAGRAAFSLRILPIISIAAFIFLAVMCFYLYWRVFYQQRALLNIRDHLDFEHLAQLDADTLKAIQLKPPRFYNEEPF